MWAYLRSELRETAWLMGLVLGASALCVAFAAAIAVYV
jgi:hypothetical protein